MTSDSSGERVYRGFFSLEDIESEAGDFSHVIMRTFEPIADLGIPAGYKPLTTIGYRWPCGCEALGAASLSWVKSCLWKACREHDSLQDGPLFARDPEAQQQDTIVARGEALFRPGQILVKQVEDKQGELGMKAN